MTCLQLATLEGCGLAIGAYPRFRYDALGGGGPGQLAAPDASGVQPLVFDPAALAIPPLDRRTARFLGLPLPPGLCIRIEPEQLSGTLDPASGAVALRFMARFHFTVGSLYRAPALLVDTVLSTGAVGDGRHHARGKPLTADGTALLVGVATIQPGGDPLFDRFLGLPDGALALLRCRFSPITDATCRNDQAAARSVPG